MKTRQLALLLGVSEATVLSWRSGRRKPCEATKRLLHVLEVVKEADPMLYACLAPKEPERKRKPSEPYQLPPLALPDAKPPKPVPREPAPHIVTYTLAAFKDGEYDDLIGEMEDEQYEVWRASLV